MPVGYHPDFAQSVPYSWERLPEDPDGQVRVTMKRVRQYLRTDSRDPFFVAHAERIAPPYTGNLASAWRTIEAVWRHMKRHLRFQHDADTAERLGVDDPRIVDTIEVLIRPLDQALLIMLRGIGVEDCDGYELYGGALLTSLGMPVSIVTIAADNDEPARFSHVYLAAYPQGHGGTRIPLDFSHGEYPGWEPPNTGRLKEWPVAVTFGELFWDGFWPVAVLSGAYAGLRYYNRRAA